MYDQFFPQLGPIIQSFDVISLTNSFIIDHTVYPKKYAHGFVVLCFVVVMQSFIMNSHEVFVHIHQGCFAGTGAIVRLPQCQWSKPDGYGEISQCITTTKHSKAVTVCIFLGIYSTWMQYYIYSVLPYCDIAYACSVGNSTINDIRAGRQPLYYPYKSMVILTEQN